MARARKSHLLKAQVADSDTPDFHPTPDLPVLRLDAAFIPPGESTRDRTDDFFTFFEIISLAKDEALRKREAEANSKIRAFKKSMRALAPDNPGIAKIMDENFATTGKMSRTKQKDSTIATREIWLKLYKYCNAGIQSGDVDAIEFLYQSALDATLLLMSAIKTHPEIVRGVARKSWGLPVIATPEGNWINRTKESLANLELGDDATFLRCRFRDAAGADENNPARLWAKGAIRTIEQTYWRVFMFSHHSKEICQLVESERIDFSHDPEWISALPKYQPFSTATLQQWSKLTRSVIREAVPDLHLRPEWGNVRASLKARSLDTPGRIRNAILDDIVSALKTIAPLPSLPESVS